jgi:putative NADH-flavin reductase
MKIAVIGASRGVGRHVAEQALARGHQVTAAVRNTADVPMKHERLWVVTCDALDPAAVAAVVQDQDVVFCAVGTDSRGPTTLYSSAARNVVAGMRQHGVRRLVFLSNFGVLDETGSDLISSLMLVLVRRVIRHTLADHRRALDAMVGSGVEWTAVRPMALTDGPLTGSYRIDPLGLPRKGRSIARADVADFMLKQAEEDRYLRQMPAIAY